MGGDGGGIGGNGLPTPDVIAIARLILAVGTIGPDDETIGDHNAPDTDEAVGIGSEKKVERAVPRINQRPIG